MRFNEEELWGVLRYLLKKTEEMEQRMERLLERIPTHATSEPKNKAQLGYGHAVEPEKGESVPVNPSKPVTLTRANRLK